jgi:DNA-binding response OmpR family regulator
MSEQAPPRLLIIEDDRTEATVLELLLSRQGFSVQVATDAAHGFAIANHAPPDVVLLDLGMPGRDGFSVLEQLKNEPRTRDVSVIVVSGSVVEKDVVRALELGATDYVTKPYGIDVLLARIRAALRSSHEKRAIWRLGEDLRAAQDELARARRSAAIGAIAASLAHEINNPAAYVVTDLHEVRDLAHDLLDNGDENRGEAIAALADEALAGMNRIRDVVRDLAVFASVVDRRSVPSAGALDLAGIVRSRAERFGGAVTLIDGNTPALVAPGLAGEDELDALVGLMLRHASAMQSKAMTVTIARGGTMVCMTIELSDPGSEPSSDQTLTLTIARELAERFGGAIEPASHEGSWQLKIPRATTSG